MPPKRRSRHVAVNTAPKRARPEAAAESDSGVVEGNNVALAPARRTSSLSSSSTSSSSSSFSASSSSTEPISVNLPSSTYGWNELPIDLCDSVCSYVGKPVLYQLLAMSAVCRRWSHMLDDDASGHVNFWRHVPGVHLWHSTGGVTISVGRQAEDDDALCDASCDRTVKQPENIASMLRTLCRVRSIDVRLHDPYASHPDFPAHIRFLDQLVPHIAASSSPSPSFSASSSSSELSTVRSPSARVRLEHLTIASSIHIESTQEKQQFSAAVSRCILRSPPLRSIALSMVECAPSLAALRHLCSGGWLRHLDVEARGLSDMEWADNVESEVVQPWLGATTVESLVLHTHNIPASDSPLKTLCASLCSLTHLHLKGHHSYAAAEFIMQRLGDRLTFLSLTWGATLTLSSATHCSALQSLQLSVHTTWFTDPHLSDYLHQLPRLSELTLFVGATDYDDEPPVLTSPLPASLTYLQLYCDMRIDVSLHGAGTAPVEELPAALPSSLRCLSLTLPLTALTDNLLSSLPQRCSQLTHCHIDYADERNLTSAESAEWSKKQDLLSELVGATGWKTTVERQRLDKRWQREVGLEEVEY